MKHYRNYILGFIAVAVIVLTAACGSQKNAVSIDETADFQPQKFLKQVAVPVGKSLPFITSKLKFSAEVGSQNISVGGQLKMKRDDVIRIQLMALGIVEAGRLEFTPDYVLMMDRINKQYVRVPYDQVDFLRQSGINFYTLQSLFLNELFEPGRQQPDLDDFQVVRQGDAVVISLQADKLNYEWQADPRTARINQTAVDHRDAQLTWNYRDFKNFEKRQLPSDMEVNVKTAKKQLKVGFQLSSFSTDDDWETRTNISSKYKQVSVDDILRRLMSL